MLCTLCLKSVAENKVYFQCLKLLNKNSGYLLLFKYQTLIFLNQKIVRYLQHFRKISEIFGMLFILYLKWVNRKKCILNALTH